MELPELLTAGEVVVANADHTLGEKKDVGEVLAVEHKEFAAVTLS